MEHNKKKKKEERIWVDTHTLYKDRKCGSGLTFSGEYKNKKHGNKAVLT